MRDRDDVYSEIATGIVGLANRSDTDQIDIPIFLDGCPIVELKQYVLDKQGLDYKDQMENVIYASSKSPKVIDEPKLDRILERAWREDRPVVALDMRSVTGTLGEMLRESVKDFVLDVDFSYTVIYDKGGKADDRAYRKGLPDDERKKYLRWLEEKDYHNIRPRFIGGEWDYSDFRSNRDKIADSKVFENIEDHIDRTF